MVSEFFLNQKKLWWQRQTDEESKKLNMYFNQALKDAIEVQEFSVATCTLCYVFILLLPIRFY